MVGLDKQPIDTDSSQASGLASCFQESINVHRGTGVSTAVTLHQSFFLHVLHWLLTSDYKIKCIPKFICSWLKVQTKRKNKSECFIIISIPGNVHYLYARAKLSEEGRVYFGTSLHRSSCPIRTLTKVSLYLSSTAWHFRPIRVRRCMSR